MDIATDHVEHGLVSRFLLRSLCPVKLRKRKGKTLAVSSITRKSRRYFLHYIKCGPLMAYIRIPDRIHQSTAASWSFAEGREVMNRSNASRSYVFANF